MLDVSVVHDVVPADALRGLGRPSALIMPAGVPALGPDRAVLHRGRCTQRTLASSVRSAPLLQLSLREEHLEVRSCS